MAVNLHFFKQQDPIYNPAKQTRKNQTFQMVHEHRRRRKNENRKRDIQNNDPKRSQTNKHNRSKTFFLFLVQKL